MSIRERFTKVDDNNVAVEQICGCDICGIYVIDQQSYGKDRIQRERDSLSARFSQLQDPNFVENQSAEVEEKLIRLDNIDTAMNEVAKEK